MVVHQGSIVPTRFRAGRELWRVSLACGPMIQKVECLNDNSKDAPITMSGGKMALYSGGMGTCLLRILIEDGLTTEVRGPVALGRPRKSLTLVTVSSSSSVTSSS